LITVEGNAKEFWAYLDVTNDWVIPYTEIDKADMPNSR